MECSRASRAPQVSAQMLVLATALLLLGIVQQVAIPALAQLRLGSPGSARHLTCSAEHDAYWFPSVGTFCQHSLPVDRSAPLGIHAALLASHT